MTTYGWGGAGCSGTTCPNGAMIALGNTVPTNVSQTNLGAVGGGQYQLLSDTPNTWFTRITNDDGTTWNWVTLASVGFGTVPVPVPTPVPTPVPAPINVTLAPGQSANISFAASAVITITASS